MKEDRKSRGFTLLELLLSTGLWLMLLGSFTAALLFGMRRMTNSYDVLSEYSRVSLFFDQMEALAKENRAIFEVSGAGGESLDILLENGERKILYFYSEKDPSLDSVFENVPYSLVLSEKDGEGRFSYGQGKRIMTGICAPPLSHMKTENSCLLLRAAPFGESFGPYQTSICFAEK